MGSFIEDAKSSWLSQIKKHASSGVMSVQADKKVVDHVDELLSWKIDFVVVKDEGRVIQGVVGRDQLRDIINEKRLEAHRGDADVSEMSFRDLLSDENLREYYVIDEDSPKTEAPVWIKGLPAREILIIKNKIVQAVVDRRWFKKWQNLLQFARAY